MSGLTDNSTKVAKTIKLYINGEFPRTESGRSYAALDVRNGKVYANLCRASRKDLRNAVSAAAGAASAWSRRSPYNRGQILYRAAEMMETRRHYFNEIQTVVLGISAEAADAQVDSAIDALVYYAGFCDKFDALISTVNPVSGPMFNSTMTEAVGVAGVVFDDNVTLAEIVSHFAAILSTGNVIVALMPQKGGALLAPLAEVFATSDVPAAVINLLTGFADELLKPFATHMEIQSLSCQFDDIKTLASVREWAVDNLKRIVGKCDKNLSLEQMLGFVEYKTFWHPRGY